MPDRRTFLITCGSMVAAPAFARFGLPSAADGLPASLSPTPSTLTLRIDGWEPQTGGADVWVQINSSWRATWR